MATCKSCGARVRWVESPKGRPMPLDFDPVPNGNVTLSDDAVRRGVVATVWGRTETIPAGLARYVVHPMTCPNGTVWRRRRG